MKFDNKKTGIALRIALFITVVALIIVFYPKEKKFKYHYEIGKPWNYELIFADFDFPVYKTEEQLKHDREDLLANYNPHFQLSQKMASEQIGVWKSNWEMRNTEPPLYEDYVVKSFQKIYQQGVIASDMMERLQHEGRSNIVVVNDDRSSTIVSLDELYTPKSAYEEIIFNRPAGYSQSELNSYNLNLYLTNNLVFDSITSINVQQDMLKNLSLTSGIVQTGEKIIDRGEIVTPSTYEILNSLKIETDKKDSILKESGFVILGEVIVVMLLILFLGLFLHLFRPSVFENFKNLLFISIQILIMTGVTALTLKFTGSAGYLIPYALVPIIIRVFYDSRTALFVHMIMILAISFMIDNPFVFILLHLAAGMTAVSGLKDLTARAQLTQTAIFIFISYLLMYVAMEMISEGEWARMNFRPIGFLAINAAMLLFAYVLIFIFEKIFNLISAITLVELTNINSDLMLKFAEVAPGTFQHTLQVSNLATEAAKKINANSLLVRTGALYHDIGKMIDPLNFIENQTGEKNPLLEMTHEEAAQAIIKHVQDGVILAKKHGLPDQIIKFITTHHGRSKTKFFYNSFVNENPGVKADKEKFTYPGPLPYSKETAILMMADAVEARSRSLPEYTEESIVEMVEDMINTQIADGQFKDAPISFMDVEAVKEVFTEKIKNIYHSRIVYPELNSDAEEAE